MRNHLLVTALLSLAVLSAPRALHAQTPAQKVSFEVASVKPNDSGDQGFGVSPQPGGFMAKNAPLDRIIA